MNAPIIRMFEAADIHPDISEILRYSGAGKTDDAATRSLAESCAHKISGVSTPRSCCCRLPVSVSGNSVDFGFAAVHSASLAKNMSGCGEAFFLAATIGAQADRLISARCRLSPAEGLLLDAAGSACIEAWCDNVNDRLAEKAAAEGLFLRPRFSPGYGDFPLSFQKTISSILETGKRIGLTLTDSLMLAPTKSVTAIIGISDKAGPSGCGRCSSCTSISCPYRAD